MYPCTSQVVHKSLINLTGVLIALWMMLHAGQCEIPMQVAHQTCTDSIQCLNLPPCSLVGLIRVPLNLSSHTQVTDQPHTRTPRPMDDAACRTVKCTHECRRPVVHGQDTVPQFVRMLFCRVISSTHELVGSYIRDSSTSHAYS